MPVSVGVTGRAHGGHAAHRAGPGGASTTASGPTPRVVLEGDIEPLLQLRHRHARAGAQLAPPEAGLSAAAPRRAIVGDDHVVDPADWLEDITEHPPGKAELTVAPGTRDEVVAVLRWAAAEGVAVTPVVAGYNVAGIAIPQGGIVLDLRRLDGIEVEADTMTVVVEPGVTFEQLKAHLDEHHPDLVYTYPFAPPFTSVLMNALLDGLNNLSLPGGAMGRWLTGVEAVLADGVGGAHRRPAASSDSWFARAPLPDLTGLFVSTQGTTGVVLRGGLASWCRSRSTAAGGSPSAGRCRRRHQAMTRAGPQPARSTTSGSHDLAVGRSSSSAPPAGWCGPTTSRWRSCSSTSPARPADGARRPAATWPRRCWPTPASTRRSRSATWCELDARVGQAGRAADHARLPARLPRRRAGVGRAPTARRRRGWPAPRRGLAALERHGFPPFLVARPMEGGRYFVLRYVACFDRADAEEVGRAGRACMGELADVVLDHGYVPHKASADAAAADPRRAADPGLAALLARVQRRARPRPPQ